MYHFQKVGTGSPQKVGTPPLSVLEGQDSPSEGPRETINTAKEVSDCRGMGTSSNSEQPVSLMKCLSVSKGQTEEEIKSTR